MKQTTDTPRYNYPTWRRYIVFKRCYRTLTAIFPSILEVMVRYNGRQSPHTTCKCYFYIMCIVIHSLFCGYEFALHERVTLRKTRPRDHGLHRPPTLPEERVRVVTFEAPSKRPRILFRVGTNNRNAQVQLSHMAPVHRAIDDATGH